MIEIFHCKRTDQKICGVELKDGSTVKDVKKEIGLAKPNLRDINRLEIRSEPKGKPLEDECSLNSLGNPTKLYFKDRGVQISWRLVFFIEYLGPFLIFPLVCSYYGTFSVNNTLLTLWSIHYFKRLAETLFIHRFSNATMPLINLWKNCSYYWGFAAFVAFYVNQPSFYFSFMSYMYYTNTWIKRTLVFAFLFAEVGNFAIHLHFMWMRPAGSKVRVLPMPSPRNPFTVLFHLVSCPNYTFEIIAWLSFAILSGAWPAYLFCLVGAVQMSVWAKGKHRNYRKQFKDYPKSRKAIIPFIY